MQRQRGRGSAVAHRARACGCSTGQGSGRRPQARTQYAPWVVTPPTHPPTHRGLHSSLQHAAAHAQHRLEIAGSSQAVRSDEGTPGILAHWHSALRHEALQSLSLQRAQGKGLSRRAHKAGGTAACGGPKPLSPKLSVCMSAACLVRPAGHAIAGQQRLIGHHIGRGRCLEQLLGNVQLPGSACSTQPTYA